MIELGRGSGSRPLAWDAVTTTLSLQQRVRYDYER
ncbi:MAG: hypothetical protein QOJ19_1827, partial [Acidimicrobiia bacterium]|nr:hypothetical protein [Acidimicrobiia bacterium]